MAKVRIAALSKKGAGARKSLMSTVRRKLVNGPKGKKVELYVVDSNDNNFDEELTRVFSLNIDRARQANTAIFGSPDGPQNLVGKANKTAQKSK